MIPARTEASHKEQCRDQAPNAASTRTTVFNGIRPPGRHGRYLQGRSNSRRVTRWVELSPDPLTTVSVRII